MDCFKRIFILFLCFAILAACFACAKTTDVKSSAKPSPDAALNSAEPSESVKLLGFIIEDDASMSAYLSMYGFLRTAETLGIPAKLYRAKQGSEASAAVSEAVNDGCSGVLIQNKDSQNDEAVRLAHQSGMKVVVPYEECTLEGVSANVFADPSDYFEELARGIAQRMTQRNLSSGRILIYGRDTAACYARFSAAIKEYYPQYTVVTFTASDSGDAAAITTLADYILKNADIKGMYVTDPDLAGIAVKARKEAQSKFGGGNTSNSNKPVPSMTTTPSAFTASTATPKETPTVDLKLLESIAITLFCNGLSDENYTLLTENDIYALCIEPYYEATAQATITLDKLLSSDVTADTTRVNRPIVYADTVEKYTDIYNSVKELFK